MAFDGIDPNSGKTEQMQSVSKMDGDDKLNYLMLTNKEGEWLKAFEINCERDK